VVTIRNASILTISSLGMLLAVGCASRNKAIPSSARLVAEDQGNVDFVAPDDGQVYVEDRSANKLLYSGQVREGQHVNVEPVKDKIAIDGQTVRDQKIRDLNTLRIFFKREPHADVAGSHTTVVAPTVVQPAQSSETIRTDVRDTRRDTPDTRDSQILVTPHGDGHEIRVRPGDSDSKITVQPGEDGSKSKVTIEHDAK
jgi:hypothetical protein